MFCNFYFSKLLIADSGNEMAANATLFKCDNRFPHAAANQPFLLIQRRTYIHTYIHAYISMYVYNASKFLVCSHSAQPNVNLKLKLFIRASGFYDAN